MFIKILIILFMTLPPALSFASNPKLADLRSQLKSKPNGSNTLYNLALSEQKSGNSALALALNEKSRFLNPFNFDAAKLSSLAYDDLSNQNNERMQTIPIFFRILDLIPYFLILISCLSSFALFTWKLGLTVRTEKTSFKTQPELRLHTSITAALVLLCLCAAVCKSVSLNETWACVIADEAGLFTGPDSEAYTKVGSLSPGTCSKVVLSSESWVSLSPSAKISGWTPKSQVLIVRANKFDPLFKSD